MSENFNNLLNERTYFLPHHLQAGRYYSSWGSEHQSLEKLITFLFYIFDQGHTAYTVGDLPQAWKTFSDQVQKPELTIPKWNQIEENPGIFGSPDPSEGGLTPFVLSGGRLWLRRNWEEEQLLSQGLKTLNSRSPLNWGVDTTVPRYQDLDILQKQAVEKALGKGIFLLSGGPGTGKTFSLTQILIQYLLKNPLLPVYLCAPTGRAADRIRVSIRKELARKDYENWNPALLTRIRNLPAQTLHRLLGGRKKDTPLISGLVILDEASMTDLHKMTELVTALNLEESHLLLSGDKDQLPSVESGAILADLTQKGLEQKEILPLSILQKCFRSDTQELVLFSRRIVGFGFPPPAPVTLEDFRNLPPLVPLKWVEAPPEDSSTQDLSHLVNALVEEYLKDYPSAGQFKIPTFSPGTREAQDPRMTKLFQKLEEKIFLCAGQSGYLGWKNLNLKIQIARGQKVPWFPGMPVLVKENNYNLGVFNGDRGLVFEDGKKKLWVLFPQEESFLRVPVGLLEDTLEPAWAMTIHKSQGSEYRQVWVFLPEKGEGLLTKQILYTGITRASEKVTLVAGEKALTRALSADTHRQSGLYEALSGGN